jgi:IMP dehydrogenase
MDVERFSVESEISRSEKFGKEGLTFDDVLLVPAESSVLPNAVSTATRLTRTIALNVPVVSAAMDTVTEARTAIALAHARAASGVVHKQPPDRGAGRWRSTKVKKLRVRHDRRTRSLIEANALLHEALELIERYDISGVPITENWPPGRHPHKPRPALREDT